MDQPQKEYEVQLYQYDLTDGMATKIVKFMTGLDFPALWHTALVVYGREYFFGGGISCGYPECTPYGIPIKKSVFGTTTKTRKEFEDYLKSIDSEFTTETYHLTKRNCNHFTDAICKYLCNKPLPDEIGNQQKLLEGTAFGKYGIPRLEKGSEKYSKIVPETFEGKEEKKTEK